MNPQATADSPGLDVADMRRLAAGEDAALNDLMDRHGSRVFHFLFRMLGDEDDARDLAQETFVRVYKNRSSFDGGERFTNWLYTIAGNLGRNQLRWRSRHPNTSLEAENAQTGATLSDVLPSCGASPGEALETRERQREVRRAILELPEGLREPLVLCEFEERSVAEAAAILEMSPKAVEARLYRARQALRERLRRWLQG
jgi:RNA polymerase sigma-70 factor (ECF subfamily)